MTDWFTWNGGDCPVPGDVRVDVRFRDMKVADDMPASNWVWVHHCEDYDIIAYRVRSSALDAMAKKLRAAGYTVTKPRSIDDIEPLREAPHNGTTYFVPSLGGYQLAMACTWGGDTDDLKMLRRGLCYATEEDAKIASRAMIEMKGGKV